MKPRQFYVIPPTKIFDGEEYNIGSVADKIEEYTENAQKEAIHVREVIPINWDRIWEQFKLQGIRFEHKNFLKELIEKALKGEE